MKKKYRLVLVGDSVFAQVAYEYFTHDSAYEVVAFSVEAAFRKQPTLFNLPVVPFETLAQDYAPTEHHVFAAVVFTQFNRLRTRLYQQAKLKGYALASYVSSEAHVWADCELGEHCFICEATVVQPYARIGPNVVLWSGNYVGHHARVGANCFTLPHAIICANAEVGENCIVGANATIGAGVTVAADQLIEAGALVLATCGAEQQLEAGPQ